jgi:hypothetical protein
MTKQQDHDAFNRDFISPWLNMAANFWNNPSAAQDTQHGQAPGTENAPPGDKNFQTWQKNFNMLASLMKLMGQPENQEALTEGMTSLAEMLMHLSEDSVENTMEFQEQLLKTLSLIGQRTKPYTFDDTEQNIFESFRTLYEQEFQKYLYIPQFGLPRFHQENLAKLADKFNVFNFNLSELLYLFSVPMDKTNQAMQDQMNEMLDKGTFFDATTQVYDEWVKTLEGHYMILLKSGKYTQTLKKTIDAMAEYRQARDEVVGQLLKVLPIPTNREMDEVYKELYTLKRQLKALSKEMSQLKKS